jgi:hypothetical protein
MGTVYIVCCLIVIFFVSFTLCCVLITRFMFFNIRFMVVFLFCMFCFQFCVFCIVLCIVSPLAHNCVFSICVQAYWPLPPGGNRTAVNKYNVISYIHIHVWFKCRMFLVELFCPSHFSSQNHTHTHTHTHGRAPLDEWSARRRSLYLHSRQQTQKTNIHDPSGIQTHDPCYRTAADLHLRPHGLLDRLM